MKEVYRKFGRALRYENAYLVRVEEAGEAVEVNGAFAAAPIELGARRPATGDLPEIDPSGVISTAKAIDRLVQPPLTLERLIVSEGVTFHEFGESGWSEAHQRVHVSIARPPYRALIDQAEFSVDTVAIVASALARVSGERDRPRRLRLAEHVGAAALPSLVGTMAMQQWAAPRDGKGQSIDNRPVSGEVPPNWFRPSYRARPLRAWFHLLAVAKGAIDRTAPNAIALLAPIHDRTLRLLCVDGDEVFAATVVLDAIGAVVPTGRWYPFGAGCFGAEMML